MAIRRKKRRFYLEVFNPEYRTLFMGSVCTVSAGKSDSLVRVFVTHIKRPDRHFKVLERGYAVNYDLLRMVKQIGVTLIIVPEDGKNGFRVWSAPIDLFLNGEALHDEEEQRVVPLAEMHQLSEKVDKEQIRHLLFD